MHYIEKASQYCAGELCPEYPVQCARQLVGGLMNGGGEVLIHHRLRLCSVADAERLAQGLDVGQVFFGPASHELAGQDIPQVAWDVEAQLLVSLEQAHGRELVLAQFEQKGGAIIV